MSNTTAKKTWATIITHPAEFSEPNEICEDSKLYRFIACRVRIGNPEPKVVATGLDADAAAAAIGYSRAELGI